MLVSLETWRSRCGVIPSTRKSTGAMFRPAAASITPWKSYWSSVSRTGFSSVSGYTFSRLNNDGAESAQGGNGVNATVQNPACPHVCEWGLSQDDTPHVFLVGYSWEIPGAKRFKGAAGALLGGWNLSGALRYESGRPLNIFMNNNLGGLIFNGQKRPNRVKGVNPIAKHKGFYNPLTMNYFDPARGWIRAQTVWRRASRRWRCPRLPDL